MKRYIVEAGAETLADPNGEWVRYKDVAPSIEALCELVALVRGECPALLNEDSGGDPNLDSRIETALVKAGVIR